MHTTNQLNVALEGRYVIDRLIGEGGMATVYLARDLRHQRRVALKVLKPDLGAVVGSERFLSEIQVTANLQHPHLLPLFDSGAAEGGLLFYVMPYIEGESLRARLQREKQLPVEDAVRLAGAIASALDYAHRHGVIHRDLKPENILLHEGQPLVADFGIALAVSNAGGNRITQTGLSLGTPQYMSPEQATGDRVIDGRTDIYSLGAVTYEMLTGEPPHTGPTSQAVIARVLTDQPRAIRLSRASVPEHVEAAVAQSLEKLPADRFASPKEFAEALTGARVLTRATSAVRVRQRRSAAHLIIAWSVAAVALAGVALLALNRPAAAPRQPLAQFELKVPDSMSLGGGGGAAYVQVSRDGSTIVFAARDSAAALSALYVRRLDEITVQKIRGTDSARSPVLSPDGSEVLFSIPSASLVNGALKRISLRGGTARTVTTDVPQNGQTSWIDANRLVFARADQLWTIPSDGGAATRLAAPDTARRHRRYGFPDVLPGGRAALITIWRTATQLDSAFVGVVSIPDGQVSELGIRGAYPRYSGTGHILMSTSDGMLVAVPFDAERMRVLGESFPVVEGVSAGAGGAATFSVARNGTLVFAPGDVRVGDVPLLLVDRTGGARSLAPQRGFYSSPRVSPDGRQVAVTVATGGSATPINPDIWRVDTASRQMMRVTTDSSSTRAVWLDANRLAHPRGPPDSTVSVRQLYVAEARKQLLRAPDLVGDIAVGPPHGYAALRTAPNGGQRDIWLVHLDSLDKPRPFLTAAYGEQSPTISPDGKLIAYVTTKTGRDEVYVQRITGGGEVQVSVSGGAEPVWSKEGGELFYREPQYQMSARIADGSPIRVLRRDSLFPDRNTFGRSPVLSNYDVFPGGKLFVMTGSIATSRGPSRLVVKMNWHDRERAAQRD